MPIALQADCIGQVAALVLRSRNSRNIGQVTNVFPNSFYLRTLNDELLFVTNLSTRSPITINLDSTLSLDRSVKPIDRVYIDGEKLHIGNISVDSHNASTYERQPSIESSLNPSSSSMLHALRTASLILRIIDTTQSVLDPQGLPHAGMARFIRGGVLRLRLSSREEQFRLAALEIVGLGPGFTPSGDDMLGGFLATYNALARTTGHIPILLDFASLRMKTTWTSAKLLDYMQRLILDEQMLRMIESAARAHENEWILALESLLPRGHASGIDISVGAILALSLIRDITFETKDTETIVDALGFSLSSV